MPWQLTEREAAGLWGDGGPCSEVRITRQVRILDDGVNRTLHYVTAIRMHRVVMEELGLTSVPDRGNA